MENYFNELYSIDVEKKVKKKNGLNYLSWAAAWAEIKKQHPEAKSITYENENGQPWFDNGKTGWVKVGVIINELEEIVFLPIMDMRNKSMLSESITSMDANKAAQRALAKACAKHGLGLYIYEGEDVPEEKKEIEKLQDSIMALAKKKCTLSPEIKAQVGEICKKADPLANGDPRLIMDLDTLKLLEKQLKAVR